MSQNRPALQQQLKAQLQLQSHIRDIQETIRTRIATLNQTIEAITKEKKISLTNEEKTTLDNAKTVSKTATEELNKIMRTLRSLKPKLSFFDTGEQAVQRTAIASQLDQQLDQLNKTINNLQQQGLSSGNVYLSSTETPQYDNVTEPISIIQNPGYYPGPRYDLASPNEVPEYSEPSHITSAYMTNITNPKEDPNPDTFSTWSNESYETTPSVNEEEEETYANVLPRPAYLLQALQEEYKNICKKYHTINTSSTDYLVPASPREETNKEKQFFETLSQAIQLIQGQPYIQQYSPDQYQEYLTAMSKQIDEAFQALSSPNNIEENFNQFQTLFQNIQRCLENNPAQPIVLPPSTTLVGQDITERDTSSNPLVFMGAIERTALPNTITCQVTSSDKLSFTYQFSAPEGKPATAKADQVPTMTAEQFKQIMTNAPTKTDQPAIDHTLRSMISLIDMVKQARPDDPIYIHHAPNEEWVRAAVLYATVQGYEVHVTIEAFKEKFKGDDGSNLTTNGFTPEEVSTFKNYINTRDLNEHHDHQAVQGIMKTLDERQTTGIYVRMS